MRTCESCGASIAVGDSFCPSCGAAQHAPDSTTAATESDRPVGGAPHGVGHVERRVTTVMFTDLVLQVQIETRLTSIDVAIAAGRLDLVEPSATEALELARLKGATLFERIASEHLVQV